MKGSMGYQLVQERALRTPTNVKAKSCPFLFRCDFDIPLMFDQECKLLLPLRTHTTFLDLTLSFSGELLSS